MRLSIIIPTLNEENHLPHLLKSVRAQKFLDYEIIVADAGSKDKTVKIAKKYGCKIVPGGLPAKGRNEGAKIAKGSLFLFLDADSGLPDDFLKDALAEFERRKLKITGSLIIPKEDGKLGHFVFKFFYNLPILLMEKILPHTAMGILIDREIFEKIGGFDEAIKLAEDHDLARRAKKEGKFGILRSSKIFVSDRRFREDGWIRTYSKFVACELHMIFIGPIKTDIFKYKFDHYSQDEEKEV